MAKTAKVAGAPVAYWVREISAARKREKQFRKDGERIVELYEGKKSSTTPFNILYSNTETLLPALYSAIPRPVVDRRFKDDDPVAKDAATAGRRMLEFLIDTNVDGYETYDEAMRAATLDALLPGRGVTCEKYDAEVEDLPTGSVDDEAPAGEDAKEEAAEPYKKSELVCSDTRSWNRVFFGYAKKWSKVPWIAFEENIDKAEALRLFGAEIANALVYTETDEEAEGDDKDKNEADQGERKTARIYQIWDKAGGKKIRYIAEQYKDGFLKVEDDPLGLTGFYNMPRPLQFLEKSNDLLPTPLFLLYENQARELNRIQLRITRMVEAIKARGIYDTELGDDLANLMKADDNGLVPADKASSLAAEKGLQNAIWFMPLEPLVAALQQLYTARESCKQVIYEITGIADIMRGQTNASETLGAQEIKQSWGTLRLKRLQKEVQRYARDLLRMKLEIAATKFSEETWARMTGLPFVTTERAQQLQKIAAAAQMAGQQLDPDTQAQLQAPVWGQVLEVLRDDIQRAYRIDIETNSTVEPEAVEDQKNIAEVMNALGQFLNGIGPLVAKGVMPWQAAQGMCMAIVRRFRFGPEIEDYIKQMKPPPAPPDEGAGKAAEAQAEQAKHAAELEARKKEKQIDAQIESARIADGKARRQAELQAEAGKFQGEQETARFKIAEETKREEMRLEAERREKQAQRAHDQRCEEMKLASQQETELKKAALVAATTIETATISATKSAETATAANEAAGQQVASTSALMEKILERQDKLLATVAAPKKQTVKRDGGGRLAEIITEVAG